MPVFTEESTKERFGRAKRTLARPLPRLSPTPKAIEEDGKYEVVVVGVCLPF